MNRLTNVRPKNQSEFKQALEQGEHLWTHCKKCGEAFTDENIHTPAGWKDTQIVGWCEDCYDAAFEEDD